MHPAAWIFLLSALLPWLANEVAGDSCNIIGEPAQQSEAPWLASVEISGKPRCGGVILKPKYVLTGGECMLKAQTKDTKVRLGASVRKSGGTMYGICQIIIHPQANAKSYESNVAILKLCEPAVMSDKVKEIKVIEAPPADGAYVMAYGWGADSWWSSFKAKCWPSSSVIMRKFKMKVLNNKACALERRSKILSPKGVTEMNICTEKPAKICSYDTGSPIISDGNLVGLLVKHDCVNKPDVYTNLAKHKDWLATNTKD
ncbi:hypothetical protein KR018_009348 [Drosophila ironensis]|nr:hypothetical protein KR018_009348 [Drosophila ironensis]